jgi:hypothetical protein
MVCALLGTVWVCVSAAAISGAVGLRVYRSWTSIPANIAIIIAAAVQAMLARNHSPEDASDDAWSRVGLLAQFLAFYIATFVWKTELASSPRGSIRRWYLDGASLTLTHLFYAGGQIFMLPVADREGLGILGILKQGDNRSAVSTEISPLLDC